MTGPATAQNVLLLMLAPLIAPVPCSVKSSPSSVMTTPTTIQTGFFMAGLLTTADDPGWTSRVNYCGRDALRHRLSAVYVPYCTGSRFTLPSPMVADGPHESGLVGDHYELSSVAYSEFGHGAVDVRLDGALGTGTRVRACH